MKKKIDIEGMSCMHCVERVEKALNELEGIESVEVSLDENSAEIELSDEIRNDVLAELIQEVGYEVVDVEDI